MQRITSIVTSRELGGFATLTSQACPWKRGSSSKQPLCRQWACMHMCTLRRHTGGRILSCSLHKLKRQSAIFAGQKYRLCSTESDNERGRSSGNPSISVVGIPDPITWIRCKVIMHLIELYFELGITSEEFDTGVKQVNYLIEAISKRPCNRVSHLKVHSQSIDTTDHCLHLMLTRALHLMCVGVPHFLHKHYYMEQ